MKRQKVSPYKLAQELGPYSKNALAEYMKITNYTPYFLKVLKQPSFSLYMYRHLFILFSCSSNPDAFSLRTLKNPNPNDLSLLRRQAKSHPSPLFSQGKELWCRCQGRGEDWGGHTHLHHKEIQAKLVAIPSRSLVLGPTASNILRRCRVC